MRPILFLAALAMAGRMAGQQPGMLDQSFGDQGKVLLPLVALDQVGSIALDDFGRIVAATYSTLSDSAQLWRFHPDGTIDPQFGSDGSLHLGQVGKVLRIHPRVDGSTLVVCNKFTLVVSSTTPWSSSTFIDTWLDANLGLSEWTILDAKVLGTIVTLLVRTELMEYYLIKVDQAGAPIDLFGVNGIQLVQSPSYYPMPMTSITVLPNHCTSVLCEDGSGPPSAGLYAMHRQVYSPFGEFLGAYTQPLVASFGLICNGINPDHAVENLNGGLRTCT